MARRERRLVRRTGPDLTVRELVAKRDRYRCVRCGRDLAAYGFNIQHRKARGMGGTKDPSVNSPANLILLCGTGTTDCHGWVESHREEARQAGWAIPWWEDPTAIPVRYPDGTAYLLDNLGSRRPA